MFVRCKKRFKDGKEHRYWSVVENVRVSGGRVVQRQVLYLGEINDSQRAAWCRSIEVVEGTQRSKQVALFPSDREAPELDCIRTMTTAMRPLWGVSRAIASCFPEESCAEKAAPAKSAEFLGRDRDARANPPEMMSEGGGARRGGSRPVASGEGPGSPARSAVRAFAPPWHPLLSRSRDGAHDGDGHGVTFLRRPVQWGGRTKAR